MRLQQWLSRPKKSQRQEGCQSGYPDISEAPPAVQMVTHQALASTFQVKRGSRAQKTSPQAHIAETQIQIVDQGARAEMASSQTNLSALETQVAAAVQALADDYLAQLSLEPTTRTRGKRNRKVRSLISQSLNLHLVSIPILRVCSFIL